MQESGTFRVDFQFVVLEGDGPMTFQSCPIAYNHSLLLTWYARFRTRFKWRESKRMVEALEMIMDVDYWMIVLGEVNP